MILTGREIMNEVTEGNITISPFISEHVNPNSYNYTLDKWLKILKIDSRGKQVVENVEIPESGYILKKDQLYLGNTTEIIGSDVYSMRLIGRSSIGRYANFSRPRSCWFLS